jgi:hypothetical protein
MRKVFASPGEQPRCWAEIMNDTQGVDDMSDHEKWISYSHWGMFMTETKYSK